MSFHSVFLSGRHVRSLCPVILFCFHILSFCLCRTQSMFSSRVAMSVPHLASATPFDSLQAIAPRLLSLSATGRCQGFHRLPSTHCAANSRLACHRNDVGASFGCSLSALCCDFAACLPRHRKMSGLYSTAIHSLRSNCAAKLTSGTMSRLPSTANSCHCAAEG